MMEAAPAAALIVPKPDLLLELLIVPLDAPAHLGEIDKSAEADVRRQCREPIFGRFGVSPAACSINTHSACSEAGSNRLCPTLTRTRAKREDSQSAEPSRHLTVRQARFGKPRITSSAEIRSGSSRRPVLFSGLPFRLGPVPDRHINVLG